MSNQLTPNQILAAQFLADGIPTDFVAKELGITLATLQKWREHPEFQDLQNKVKQQGEAEAYKEIFAMKPLAVQALREMLNSKDSRTRLKAADLILTFGM